MSTGTGMPGLHRPFEEALAEAVERAIIALGAGSAIVLAIGSVALVAAKLAPQPWGRSGRGASR